ncbi:MAG: DUF3108 domain-containing protein [Gammaproteobacteria bacterium]|nr:DUF3108 domain-containing protein [Gammaproteobacteria bacterium]
MPLGLPHVGAIATFVASLGLALPVHADIALTPHTAGYKVKISVLGGELRTRLEATADGYLAESSIEATGMSRIIAHGAIRESSEFSATPQGLRPNRFLSDDTLTSDKEKVDFVFDWDAGLVSGTINGSEFSAGMDGIVHDRVSLQYGLMYDLANGVERANYSLQDAEKFKPLSISNIGVKEVRVPYGRFEAIGIQHQSAGSSRVTTLWVVPELGYLPVIIEQHRKGKLGLRAVLTDYAPIADSAGILTSSQ